MKNFKKSENIKGFSVNFAEVGEEYAYLLSYLILCQTNTMAQLG